MTRSHTERFRITWDKSVSQYKVSIPNYDGGEVVTAEAYDRMRSVLDELYSECIAAGHGSDRDFGWPGVMNAAKEALADESVTPIT